MTKYFLYIRNLDNGSKIIIYSKTPQHVVNLKELFIKNNKKNTNYDINYYKNDIYLKENFLSEDEMKNEILKYANSNKMY